MTAPASDSLASLIAIQLLPQVLTAFIAGLAIIASRRSSRESVEKDLKLRMWEKRTDVYLEFLTRLDRQDPTRHRSLNQLYAEACEGETVSLLREDMGTEDWKNFEARLRAHASKEIWSFYLVWRTMLGTWAFLQGSCLIHRDTGKAESLADFEARQARTMKGIHRLSQLIAHQLRAELRFEIVPLRRIEYIPGPVGGIEDIRVQGGGLEEDVPYDEPLTFSTATRHSHGWSFSGDLPPGTTYSDWFGHRVRADVEDA